MANKADGGPGPMAPPSGKRPNRSLIGLRVQRRYPIISELRPGAPGNVFLTQDDATGLRIAIRFFPRDAEWVRHATKVGSICRSGA